MLCPQPCLIRIILFVQTDPDEIFGNRESNRIRKRRKYLQMFAVNKSSLLELTILSYHHTLLCYPQLHSMGSPQIPRRTGWLI